MQTTKPIHEHLLMPESEYNEYLVEYLLRWCQETERKTGVDFQIILANTLINNWYNTNFSRLHDTALEALNNTFLLKYKQKRVIYASIIGELFVIYPSALITEAKKLKIENYYAN